LGLSRWCMSLLVLNIGISFSATATTCPLRGFRPVRASRLLTLKAPKPRSSTRLPRASASAIVPRMVLTTASTSRWYRCGFCSAILAINSDLIIKGKRLRIECDRLVDQLGDIEIAIHGTPAETLRGVVMKAAVATLYLDTFYTDNLVHMCFASIIADMERIAGAEGAHA
jgi:hypothetical protein